MSGNGSACYDIDECDLYEPCDRRVHCTNLAPGFVCDPCPEGYAGEHANGVRVQHMDHTFKRQSCVDVDECIEGTARCPTNAICVNLDGSYDCECPRGYIRNSTYGCFVTAGMCPDGTMCDKNAHCKPGEGYSYRCKCKVGWAGDGLFCG